MTLPVTDPKRNAGIGLTRAEIEKLDKFCIAASLSSRSAVVSLLIKKGLPELWMSLEVGKGKTLKDVAGSIPAPGYTS